MIIGRFGEIGELIFDIEIIASDGELYPLEVILDTGFTTGWLALDFQDAESLGWPLIQKNRAMQMARGEELFDIYEGKVMLNEQEYIIPVVTSRGVREPLLGLQWLKILPLSVNFAEGVLRLG
jgi:predicted aspartyl protease